MRAVISFLFILSLLAQTGALHVVSGVVDLTSVQTKVATQSPGDNTTNAASTAFVQAAVTAGGGSSAPFYLGPSLTPLDVVGNWASINFDGTSSFTRINTNVAEQIKFTGNASANWRLRTENLPAAPYTITATLTCSGFIEGNSAICGIYLYDGTKLIGLEHLSATALNEYRVERITNVTTDGSTSATAVTGSRIGRVLVLRLKDDNIGNRFFYYSEDDGNTFTQLFTEGSTQFLTPTKWGYGGLNAISTNNAEVVRLVSMKITSP